jgi:hypothetical protein
MTYILINTENFKKEIFNPLTISSYIGITYAIIPIMILIFPGILYGIPQAVSHDKSKKNEILEIEKPIIVDLKSDNLTTSQLIAPLQIRLKES